MAAWSGIAAQPSMSPPLKAVTFDLWQTLMHDGKEQGAARAKLRAERIRPAAAARPVARGGAADGPAIQRRGRNSQAGASDLSGGRPAAGRRAPGHAARGRPPGRGRGGRHWSGRKGTVGAAGGATYQAGEYTYVNLRRGHISKVLDLEARTDFEVFMSEALE